MQWRAITGRGLERWYDQELSQTFPPHERKPLAHIRALMAAGRYTVWGWFEGDVLLGYAALWREPSDGRAVLVDYLGVTPARRNGGLGGEMVGMLARRAEGKYLLLIEAECPAAGVDPAENALRRRRLEFYARCGLVPAYDMAACGMRFKTFLSQPPADLTCVMAAHRAIYGGTRPDVQIPLGPDQTPPSPPVWMREGEGAT